MKPTLPHIASRRSFSARQAGLPKTDYQFRPNSMADFGGGCHGNPEPSFRGVSQAYFKHEARGHFVSEAAIFVLIAITAVVAVVQGVRVGMSAFGLL